MFGLHLVWSLWISTLDESTIVRDFREKLESLLKALQLHWLEYNIDAISSTTQNGVFWFCRQKLCHIQNYFALLTKIAYSTVVLTIAKTPVNSLNVNQ